MINHVMVGASDIERSKAFYNAVLGVLGAGEPITDVNATGQTRLFYMHAGGVFAVSEPIDGAAATCANGATIGFKCARLEQVKAFHDAAIAAGGKSIEDPPGPRDSNLGTMNLCYFLDPDGHKICGIQMGA